MYKCNCCQEVFETPRTYSECVGEFWGTPAFQEFGCCPCCGEDEYSEVIAEDIYGDEISEEDTYYEFYTEKGEKELVLEENLKDYLIDCRVN